MQTEYIPKKLHQKYLRTSFRRLGRMNCLSPNCGFNIKSDSCVIEKEVPFVRATKLVSELSKHIQISQCFCHCLYLPNCTQLFSFNFVIKKSTGLKKSVWNCELSSSLVHGAKWKETKGTGTSNITCVWTLLDLCPGRITGQPPELHFSWSKAPLVFWVKLNAAT